MNNRLLLTVRLLIIAIMLFFGYYSANVYIENQLKEDKASITGKINDLLNDKDAVIDGQTAMLRVDETKRGFTLLSGGFTIYKIKKENDGYTKSTLTPGDITVLKEGVERSEYGAYYVYSRPEPEQAYYRMFRELVKGDDDEPNPYYSKEAFDDLKNFPTGFSSRFHNITHIPHPVENYVSRTTPWRRTLISYEIGYLEFKQYYSVSENSESVASFKIQVFSVFIGLSAIIGVIISFIVRVKKPDSKIFKRLTNRKWKNLDSKEIVIIDRSIRDSAKLKIIKDNIALNGEMNYSDKDNTLTFVVDGKAFIYKPKILESGELVLEDISTDELFKYEEVT